MRWWKRPSLPTMKSAGGCRRQARMLRTKAKFIKMSAAGLRESHVHDVVVTEEAPNYRA